MEVHTLAASICEPLTPAREAPGACGRAAAPGRAGRRRPSAPRPPVRGRASPEWQPERLRPPEQVRQPEPLRRAPPPAIAFSTSSRRIRPPRAGARDLRQVQVVLRREAPHQRRERPPRRPLADAVAGVACRSCGGRARVPPPGRRALHRRHSHGARTRLADAGQPACRPAPSPPAARGSRASTPSYGLGISESTLSVDTSNSGSSNATGSPTFLSQLLDRALGDGLARAWAS